MKYSRATIGSIFVLIVVLFFVGRDVSYDKINETFAKDIEYSDGTLTFDGGSIQVALAETDEERRTGLSRQRTIGENEGLLFIFNESDEHGIWMRDMYFPIDIIWLDNVLGVVDFKENATPESFRSLRDAEVFTPSAPALYVLEVRAGFVDTQEVVVGDTFSLMRKR